MNQYTAGRLEMKPRYAWISRGLSLSYSTDLRGAGEVGASVLKMIVLEGVLQ
jgi:hypothetical protein